ncbi:MAG: DNA repair protein RecO, partial [Flavobacteriaceae bacterium]
MKSTVHAFALHTLRYGDSSLIVSCFTKQYGLQSYMLRGILGGKRKKKVSKSLFEPLNLVAFEASKTGPNKLGYLNEAHILQPYTAIPFDLKKKAVIFFLAEVIYQIVQEEQEANPGLFS